MVAPLLFGPALTTIAIVTVGVVIGPNEPLVGGPFMNWLFGVVVFGALALIQGACLFGFDRLSVRFGSLALTRRSAWLAGLVAPLPVGAVWALAPPARQPGATFWIILFAPLPGSAAVVRLAWTRIIRRDI